MKAKNIVHWPGKEVAACLIHTEKLKVLAQAMGFSITTEPCFTEEVCKNCENEQRDAGSNH